MLASLAASILDSVPGLFFGLPVLVAASVVFAATHHEDPEEIQAATIHWAVETLPVVPVNAGDRSVGGRVVEACRSDL